MPPCAATVCERVGKTFEMHAVLSPDCEAPSAAQAPAVSLTLGKAALDPTVDRATRVRSLPRLDEARRYLQPTLDASLSPIAVARTHEALALAFDKAGRGQDAKLVRQNAIQKLGGKEAAAPNLRRMRRQEQ